MQMKSRLLSGLLITLILIPSLGWAGKPEQQTNKEKVIEFYQKTINEKDYSAAQAYVADKYIQHNPMAADGKDGLFKFITYLRTWVPQYHGEIKQVFTDKDYVILHVYTTTMPGRDGRAVVDIYRLEKGKIVEHWDVMQEIPKESANSNGMF